MSQWHTIANLRLDIESAMQGKTWLLLPEGFRETPNGSTYPLPYSREELKILTLIPTYGRKQDTGATYIRRAVKEFKIKSKHRVLQVMNQTNNVENARAALYTSVQSMKMETRKAIAEVHDEARKAVASLSQLFEIGREGIEGQMKAHLEGTQWHGETISAKDFRECFRTVLHGIKGLGLPSEQRASATDAVMQEIAESIKATHEVVALASGNNDETEH